MATRLDNSFHFLLPDQRKDYPKIGANPDLFLNWLAGIIDADGSITIVRSGIYLKLALLVSNQDQSLLSHVRNQLSEAGYHPSGPYLQAHRGEITPNWNIRHTKDMWSLYLQRAEGTRRVSSRLPLKHAEKIMRKELAMSIPPGAKWKEFGARTLALRSLVEKQVSAYVSKAEIEYKKRDLGQAT